MALDTAKKSKVVSCYCNWPECEKYHSIIQARSPIGHKWRLSPLRIQFTERDPAKMYVTKSTFWQFIVRRLRLRESITLAQSEIFVHPDHFPLLFWKWNDSQPSKKNICTPLTKSAANQICRHDQSHDRFTNVSNSVFSLHNHSIVKQQSTYEPPANRFKLKYAKSPFVSRNEVKSLVQTITNVTGTRCKLPSSSFTSEIDIDKIKLSSIILAPLSTPSDLSANNIPVSTLTTSPTTRTQSPMISLPPISYDIFPSKYMCYTTLRLIYQYLHKSLSAFRCNEYMMVTNHLLLNIIT